VALGSWGREFKSHVWYRIYLIKKIFFNKIKWRRVGTRRWGSNMPLTNTVSPVWSLTHLTTHTGPCWSCCTMCPVCFGATCECALTLCRHCRSFPRVGWQCLLGSSVSYLLVCAVWAPMELEGVLWSFEFVRKCSQRLDGEICKEPTLAL